MGQRKVAIAIHGGAGNLARYVGSGRLEEAEDFLRSLVKQMHANLIGGSTSLDVVTDATIAMEDSGLFHAGRGSSPTSSSTFELDASVMSGHNLKAGAVGAVCNIKNPIKLARYIMEHTEQVFIVGKEAQGIASDAMTEVVPDSYFIPCDEIGGALTAQGTVGAIALDVFGNVAAATSTGGTLRKRSGRVGDTPIIGAGTYADNNVGAISCTGVGEYFIRLSAASRVIARMEFLNELPKIAGNSVLHEIVSLGGSGGMIILNPQGKIAMPFTTTGMYRASVDDSGELFVACL